MASVGAVSYIGGIVRRFLTPIHRVSSAAFQPAVPLCFFPSFFEPFFDRRLSLVLTDHGWLMAGWQAAEGAGRASSDSRRSQPAAAGPEPAARPRTGSQRAHQRPQRHPQGDAATPSLQQQPACQSARPRQAARRRRRRPPKATACPLCLSPAMMSRAPPRLGARTPGGVGARPCGCCSGCCCCSPPLQPPPQPAH